MRSQQHVSILVILAVAVLASASIPTYAWAKYRSPGAETNMFATHVLVAPGQPVCSGLGILSVTLTWNVTDAKALTYDLGVSGTSGGPYTYSHLGSSNSTSPTIGNGHQYFVVRAVNHQWIGPDSPEQEVTGVVIIVPLVATCP